MENEISRTQKCSQEMTWEKIPGRGGWEDIE
jgi:hypothetical protein